MESRSLSARLVLIAGLALAGLSASEPVEGMSARIEPALARETVEALCQALNREYFDVAVAARVSETLKSRLASGRYQPCTSAALLGEALTADLLELTGDKHLVVSPWVEPASVQERAATADPTPRDVAAHRSNLGVQRIEILPGNVGYLRLTAFYRPDEARDALAAAMAALRHADALILDLRDNGGGSSGTVALVASYFFEAPGLPLFEVVPRPPAKISWFATEAAPPRDRNEQRPMYVLVSQNTWSAGELLAFILQERHRAGVIGQATPGAGNQGRTHRLNPWFEATISNGMVRIAPQGRSLEGKGVAPDAPAPPSEALRLAHARALRDLIRNAPAGTWRETLERELSEIQKQKP